MRDIRLLKPHTHAGTPHPAGYLLTVDDATADWLVAQGVGDVERFMPAAPQDTRRARRPKPSDPHIADTDTTGDDHEH